MHGYDGAGVVVEGVVRPEPRGGGQSQACTLVVVVDTVVCSMCDDLLTEHACEPMWLAGCSSDTPGVVVHHGGAVRRPDEKGRERCGLGAACPVPCGNGERRERNRRPTGLAGKGHARQEQRGDRPVEHEATIAPVVEAPEGDERTSQRAEKPQA